MRGGEGPWDFGRECGAGGSRLTRTHAPPRSGPRTQASTPLLRSQASRRIPLRWTGYVSDLIRSEHRQWQMHWRRPGLLRRQQCRILKSCWGIRSAGRELWQQGLSGGSQDKPRHEWSRCSSAPSKRRRRASPFAPGVRVAHHRSIRMSLRRCWHVWDPQPVMRLRLVRVRDHGDPLMRQLAADALAEIESRLEKPESEPR